jgi:hypothetical protein
MRKFICFFLSLFLVSQAYAQTAGNVQGSYATSIFAQSNFVKNPNAVLNFKDVTASDGATISRVLTTPLVANTEFNIVDGTAAWGATWATRAFDAGMKNRNCEVAMTVRGVAAGTTTLQVLQNAVAVFSQTVVLDATNPKRIGGTFPCGDLTYASTISLAGSGAITGAVEVGGVYIGLPVSVSSGQITTEWQSYPSTVGGFSATPTSAFKYRRIGDSLEITGKITKGATTYNGVLSFTIPSGLVIDVNKTEVATYAKLGTASAEQSSGNYQGIVFQSGSSTTTLIVYGDSGLGNWSGATNVPVTSANLSSFQVQATVPILGWAATDIVTPESSISGQARYTTVAQTIEAGTEVLDFNTKVYDINNEVTAGASWLFTAKTAGFYSYNVNISVAASTSFAVGEFVGLIARVNGAEANRMQSDPQTTGVSFGIPLMLSGIVSLNAGQTMDFQVVNGSGSTLGLVASAAYNQVAISKITGPGSQSFYLQGPVKGGNSGNAIPQLYAGSKVPGTLRDAYSIAVSTSEYDIGTVTLNKGSYIIFATCSVAPGASTQTFAQLSISDANTIAHNNASAVRDRGTNVINNIKMSTFRYVDVAADGTNYYMVYSQTFTGTAGVTTASSGQFYAVRLD